MTYGNYKTQKPLSSRLRVETGTNVPDKVKRHPVAKATPEGLPNYMKPIRSSGKSQGTIEGTAAEFKEHLASIDDNQPLAGWEAHAAQMFMEGNSDAIDCF